MLLTDFSQVSLGPGLISFCLSCSPNCIIRPPEAAVAIVARAEAARQGRDSGHLSKSAFEKICKDLGTYGVVHPCRHLNDPLAAYFAYASCAIQGYGHKIKKFIVKFAELALRNWVGRDDL